MKSRIVAGLLAISLGSLGVHKFYLGKTVLGILYLLFFWTYIPGIVGFVEGILILISSDESFNEKYNENKALLVSESVAGGDARQLNDVKHSLVEPVNPEIRGEDASPETVTNSATSGISSSTKDQSSQNAEKNISEEPIGEYGVLYLGGHPDYPKEKKSEIKLRVFEDRFDFQPTIGSKSWFRGNAVHLTPRLAFAGGSADVVEAGDEPRDPRFLA